MEEKRQDLKNIEIADFMKREGYYANLGNLLKNSRLSKKQLPEQKTKINWKNLKEKLITYSIVVTVGAGLIVGSIKFWKYQDEKIRSQEPQEVIHIDTSTPTPTPVDYEKIYLEEQQKELEKAQEDIIKNYYEGDDLIEKVGTTKEVYSAPSLTKTKINVNVSEYDRTNAGISIPNNNYENSIIQPGSNYSECEKYLTTDLENKFKEAGNIYGDDPNLLTAIGMQETTLGKDLSNSYAIGIMQIEKVLLNETVKAYNYQTKEFENKKIIGDNISNTTNNINIGAAMLQARSSKYDNYLIAIQSYNYGPEVMEIVLSLAEKSTGKSRTELTFDEIYPSIEYVHLNPQKTISKNWKFKTYGDKDYAKKVVSYLKTNLTYNKVTLDGNTINLYVYDASTGNKIKTYIQDGDLLVDKDTNQRYTENEIINAINNISNIIDENKSKKTK